MPDLTIVDYAPRPHLGRHHVSDPRSLAYRRTLDPQQPLHPTAWEPALPALDQQHLTGQNIHTTDLGLPGDVDALASCTGQAATTALTLLLNVEQQTAAGLDTSSAQALQKFAIGVYADATRRDTWHTQPWPADSGASTLAAVKVLRGRGLIDQYAHATTPGQLCALLQTGPVLMGLPWRAAFSEPGAGAFIDVDTDWLASPLEGGHCVCVTALEEVTRTASGGVDTDRSVIRFRNSWSPAWGDTGDGRMRLSTYLALREDIDLIQPRLDPGTRT